MEPVLVVAPPEVLTLKEQHTFFFIYIVDGHYPIKKKITNKDKRDVLSSMNLNYSFLTSSGLFFALKKAAISRFMTVAGVVLQ